MSQLAATRPADSRPILVTGAPRSGTTWVGKMLALAPGIGYIHEPFNPVTPKGVSAAPVQRVFEYVSPDREADFARPLDRALGFRYAVGAELPRLRSPRDAGRAGRDLARTTRWRLERRRALVEDPIALFSAEWLAARFDMDVVVTIRHPAAVVASFKRLGWTHRFRSFLEQPALMDAYLRPFEPEIRAYADQPPGTVDQATLLWNLCHHVIRLLRDRHGEWSFVRHEDLSRDPLPGYEALYRRLGLELTPESAAAIADHSSAKNPAELRRAHDVRLDSRAGVENWRRVLTPDEIGRVRESTAELAGVFYPEDGWW